MNADEEGHGAAKIWGSDSFSKTIKKEKILAC